MSEPSAAPSDARFTRWLLVITGLGAAWRLLYLFVVKLDDELILNDSVYYLFQAGRNSEGDWFRERLTNLPGAEHGPLTSLYLTPWSLGGGANLGRLRFAVTLLGIATVYLMGLLGRRVGGTAVGLVAASIAAAYPNLWINDSLVMSETLALLLVTASLIVALRLDRSPSIPNALALGALVGLAALTRSEIALFAVGYALVAWWRGTERGWARLARPAVLLAASLATVTPWMLYNHGRFEHSVLLSTNEGNTFLGANCDSTYYDDIGGWDLRCTLVVDDASPDAGDESVRSAQRRSVAVDYVQDHLDRVPVVVAARLGRMLDVYGLDSLVRLDVSEEKAEWAVWIGIVMFWALTTLAAYGWWQGRRTRKGEWWWLAVPVAAVVVTSVLFYGAHRLRAPAEPVVVVVAAVGAVALYRRWRGLPVDAPVDPPINRSS